SMVLAANLENLTFISVANADGYGNSLDNVLTAGGGNNILSGGSGTDTVSYATATSAVTVSLAIAGAQATGGSGTDTLSGFENLTGSAFNDNLTGNAGANVLDGGLGADTMTGGDGNDVYFYDNAGDTIIETSTGGIDEVRTFGSLVLGANLENLTLMTTGAADGYGNGLDNRLTGGAGANILSAGAGTDTLVGGAGNDTLTGGSGNDTFVLNSLIGSDTITDFTSGSDKISISQAGIVVGNGNTTIDGATTVAGPGGFSTAAELVVVTANIAGAINTTTAAAAIGSATGAYTIGSKALFIVDNGTSSALYLFGALDADAQVESAELTLLASLSATPSVGTGDLLFGP
ncbi:MAG: calcium-binding protein, partial [Rubrivivax sp.]|nr:calcium-binding protein [Rubrivivax sp.]